nr:zinc transporter ZntB [uncultured Hyphomonas sp.]
MESGHKDPMIFGFGFDEAGLHTPLTWDDVLEGAHSKYKRVWIHLDRHSAQAQGWLYRKSGLDRLTVQALLQEETRPRAARYGQGYLINLRGPNLNEGADVEDLVTLRMWAAEDVLITVRARPVRSAFDVREMVEEGEIATSTGALVAGIADRLTDRMEVVLEDFDDEADRYEDELLDPKASIDRSVLPEFRRRVLQVRRHIMPQREALGTLVRDGAQSGLFSDQDLLFLRESADRITRLTELVENIRERSTVLYEEAIQNSTEETNQRLFVLAILSAVFLPISFVTGLFGVNLGGIPGSSNPVAFFTLVIALSLSATGTLALLRWQRWI